MLIRHVLGLSCLLAAANVAPAAISVDANVSADQATANRKVATRTFSTASGNELLLAFISTDALPGANTTVTGVSGGGLTWTLVVRANGQPGTSEIWRAFAPGTLNSVSVTATLSQSVVSSMTLLSFAGVDSSGSGGSGAIGAIASQGASSGAPAATLITTRNNSWVFGVGNDYDNAIARTPGAGQTLVHQYLAPVGDTYWVQRQNSPTLAVGTTVTINDIAPATDHYNLAIVEVLPVAATGATYSISGSVGPTTAGVGTLLTLTGTAAATATADTSGNYTFTGLPNGSYAVTPAKTGYTFAPTSIPVTVSGANVTGVNFTGTAVPTWSISGAVSPASLGAGALLTLSGSPSGTTTADASGNYSFTGLPNGAYTITPSKTGYTFTPTAVPVNVSGANVPGINLWCRPQRRRR